MYAFYNPTTKKYMYYYPYHYYDEICHSLDRDSTGILFVHHDRSVLQNIMDRYKDGYYGDGGTIRTIDVDHGLLDGFEIIQLGHI